MGPKVEACIKFLEGGGKRVIIGQLNEASATLKGEAGSHVYTEDNQRLN
jgi:carbamate kinase